MGSMRLMQSDVVGPSAIISFAEIVFIFSRPPASLCCRPPANPSAFPTPSERRPPPLIFLSRSSHPFFPNSSLISLQSAGRICLNHVKNTPLFFRLSGTSPFSVSCPPFFQNAESFERPIDLLDLALEGTAVKDAYLVDQDVVICVSNPML